MKTSEILTLQALKFKKDLSLGAKTDAPAWMADFDSSGESRNVCALITIPLFDEINRLSDVLSMSKRLLIEMALKDMVIKANEALEGVGISNASSSTMGTFPVDEA